MKADQLLWSPAVVLSNVKQAHGQLPETGGRQEDGGEAGQREREMALEDVLPHLRQVRRQKGNGNDMVQSTMGGRVRVHVNRPRKALR